MTELKPCPFCGGIARISVDLEAKRDSEGRLWAFTVVCDRCAASTGVSYKPGIVTKLWNRRAKAVSLHDIYRIIAGHSYYHGDYILAALTCIAEGKEVNPVRPADVAPVVHGKWLKKEKETYCPVQYGDDGEPILHKFTLYFCNLCGRSSGTPEPYCHCGAKMDGGAE